MPRKGFSEIHKINDPWERLMAAIIYQAILDYFNPPDMETWLSAYHFLDERGGVYDHLVSYDIKRIWQLAKEKHERDSLDSE